MTKDESSMGGIAPASSEISIQLNGEPLSVAMASTLADLLDRLGKEPRTVAVEHNGAIVPRARYAETGLAEGDRLEIVHFVQGGAPPQGEP